MLIREAEIAGGIRDVRIAGTTILGIGARLKPRGGEMVVEASGGALLPGLRDHHLHLASLAAARTSLQCGPPAVRNAEQLAALLRDHAGDTLENWVRGIGYHESVASDIDRHWLDLHMPQRPLRIQHRGGRLWVLNSLALRLLRIGDEGDDPFERVDGKLTGRLYDDDAWLRGRLSRHLASRGVVGITDTSPGNSPQDLMWFRQAQQRLELRQDLLAMGDASLNDYVVPERANPLSPALRIGAHKFHLHEAHLPDFDEVCNAVRVSHQAGRGAAFHCVTRAELVFALGALREAGVQPGDRIEHAAVTPPELLQEISTLGLTVVTQPGFISERGDAYLQQVDADDQLWLYRLRGFLDAGVPLAGSTDAPFAEPEPWRAMQAAVDRRSAEGRVLQAAEGLTPEQALALFTAPLEQPGGPASPIAIGAQADLCLLSVPWSAARHDLAVVRPRLTLRAGQIIWSIEGAFTHAE
jgi:predicted amidohydrolase YtcJ